MAAYVDPADVVLTETEAGYVKTFIDLAGKTETVGDLYRRLARTSHPNRGGKEEVFKPIQGAMEALRRVLRARDPMLTDANVNDLVVATRFPTPASIQELKVAPSGGGSRGYPRTAAAAPAAATSGPPYTGPHVYPGFFPGGGIGIGVGGAGAPPPGSGSRPRPPAPRPPPPPEVPASARGPEPPYRRFGIPYYGTLPLPPPELEPPPPGKTYMEAYMNSGFIPRNLSHRPTVTIEPTPAAAAAAAATATATATPPSPSTNYAVSSLARLRAAAKNYNPDAPRGGRRTKRAQKKKKASSRKFNKRR